jgi:hypothetical protein
VLDTVAQQVSEEGRRSTQQAEQRTEEKKEVL